MKRLSPRKKFKTIIEGKHVITDIKEIKVGDYVMIKDISYFSKVSVFYGFNNSMMEACGKVFRVKKIVYSSGVIHKLYFEKPEDVTSFWWQAKVSGHSWNNEMVIPMGNRNKIKI